MDDGFKLLDVCLAQQEQRMEMIKVTKLQLGKLLCIHLERKNVQGHLERIRGTWTAYSLVKTSDLNTDMKHISGRSEKFEEENEWEVAAEESQTASLEKIHVKVEPLKEIAAEEDQTAKLKVHEAKGVIRDWKHGKGELYQLVGRLKCVWSELDVLRPNTSDPKVIQKTQEQDVVFNMCVVCVGRTRDQLSGEVVQAIKGEG
ncbi:hypothetical protein F2Q69_00022624 [Brassica cretica]|uniref:Uncharacterized protein n=1 Tax=Brassica cretica TaxID=69181 RepID=A0A8S9QLQ6_BRACR|nr:hypothetical protein F2Q69_00022624 [Brassica cretica]